jgi:two-component system response regulator VicR
MPTIGVLNISGKLEQKYINSLEKEQYQVIPFHSNQELSKDISKIDGLIIFDENQENVGGICNLILTVKRETKAFIWTASKTIPPVNRLVYLQLGAAGNIGQECEPEELRLIIRNTLGNHGENNFEVGQNEEIPEEENPIMKLNNFNQSVCIRGGEEIGLTKLEFKVLDALDKNRGRTLGYQEIHELIWKDKKSFSKARIANLIFHVREKIEVEDSIEPYIKTIRSKGYLLVK